MVHMNEWVNPNTCRQWQRRLASCTITMPEAGPAPSSAPLFKKRGKTGGAAAAAASRLSTSVIAQPASSATADSLGTLPEDAQQSQDQQLSVQDLIALRALNRKPTGIDLERLNKPQHNPKTNTKPKSAAQLEQERCEQQMKQGGLVASGSGGAAGAAGDQGHSDQE